MRTFLRAFLFSCLFYFLAIVVLFRLGAFSQTKPEQPSYELTELQKAHLDATRQEVFRWQDKLNEALGKFSAQCTQAQKENKWPNVQCSLEDLSVKPQTTPEPAAAPKK
jgi:hypothetical protein